jgi:hypothetical protein
MDIFGGKAKAAADNRAKLLQEIPQKIADNPHKAHEWIKYWIDFVIQNDTPLLLGPRYTEVWQLYLNHLTTYLAVAERATRIERIAEMQAKIASVEKSLAKMANGTYDFGTPEYTEGPRRGKRTPPWTPEDHANYVKVLPINYAKELAGYKEKLMAAKYGPITWPVKERERWYYDIGSPVYNTASPGSRQLTKEEIETAVKELDKR